MRRVFRFTFIGFLLFFLLYHVKKCPQSCKHSKQLFILGSNLTLLKSLSRIHPDLSQCYFEQYGELINKLYLMRLFWEVVPMENDRLTEAGISKEILDVATNAFISELMSQSNNCLIMHKRHHPMAYYLQAKFPGAKFVLISGKLISPNENGSKKMKGRFVRLLGKSGSAIMSCEPDIDCLNVIENDLIQNPKSNIPLILDFLNITFDEKSPNYFRFNATIH